MAEKKGMANQPGNDSKALSRVAEGSQTPGHTLLSQKQLAAAAVSVASGQPGWPSQLVPVEVG